MALDAVRSHGWLYIVVDLLFVVAQLFIGSLCLVLVLLCSNVCPF